MKTKHWSLLFDFFSDTHKRWEHYLQKEENKESLLYLRTSIRKSLETLKSQLSEFLNEREVYLTLFPLVIYFDEFVLLHQHTNQKLDWPPLQYELYNTYNGGEVFYETLQDLLNKPDTLPMIYEIYYYCLKKGFKGKYIDAPEKIEEILSLCRQNIPLPTIDEVLIEEDCDFDMDYSPQPKVIKPWIYYGAASVLLAFVYSVLQIVSSV